MRGRNSGFSIMVDMYQRHSRFTTSTSTNRGALSLRITTFGAFGGCRRIASSVTTFFAFNNGRMFPTSWTFAHPSTYIVYYH